MAGALKFENKPLTIRWYLLTRLTTTPPNEYYNYKR